MSMITAQQFEENEEYEKAYEDYKTILENRPNDTEVLERLGHIAIILEKKDEAEEYYNRLLEIDAKSELAYEQLMDIYISNDKYKYYISRGNLHIIKDEITYALSDYKKALGKAQTDRQAMSARFILATLYERLEKDTNAIDEYLRVIESDFATEIAYLNLAHVYYREDAITSAIETLERAINRGFDSAVIKENLAKLYSVNNNHDKIREVTENELVKIKSYLDEGLDDKAFELLNNIEEQYKQDPQYYILVAQYHFNKEEWDKSYEYVEKFATYGQNAALVYQMKALIFEGKQMDYESHLYWARYNLARRNKDVALNEYYIALKERENDPELIFELASLLDDVGDKVQAGEFWQKLLSIEPENEKALERTADFKDSIGDYKGEVEILKKLYEKNKRNTIVIKKLAVVCEKIKEKQLALEYYKKYLENSLMDDEYKMIEQKVQNLEKNITKEEPIDDDEGLIGKIIKLFSKK